MIFFFLYRKVVQQLVSWCQLPTIDHCSRTFVCIAPMLFCFPSPRHSALKSAKNRATFFHLFFSFIWRNLFAVFPVISWIHQKTKKNCGAFFFKLLGTFLGMNKGSADGNPQPLIEYVQKNHQIMQFDTENHMKKLLTCGILHYMIDVKELAYEILVHFRYLHCRVINERVQDRKNYSEISALLQIERGSNGYSMFFSLLLHFNKIWTFSKYFFF